MKYNIYYKGTWLGTAHGSSESEAVDDFVAMFPVILKQCGADVTSLDLVAKEREESTR